MKPSLKTFLNYKREGFSAGRYHEAYRVIKDLGRYPKGGRKRKMAKEKKMIVDRKPSLRW